MEYKIGAVAMSGRLRQSISGFGWSSSARLIARNSLCRPITAASLRSTPTPEASGGCSGRARASARAAPFPSAPQWRRARGLLRSWLTHLGWTIVSVGLFAAIWELCWYFGWADPRLLPPPHVFLSDLTGQAKFFNTAQRWQVGVDSNAGPSPAVAVLITILSSTIGPRLTLGHGVW